MTAPAPAYTPILGPSIRAVLDAGRLVERIIDAVSPVRTSALLTLEEIALDPGVMPSVLVKRIGVEKQTLAGLVNRLRDQGLVVRVDDPDDGRVVHMHLTPAGEAKLAETREAVATIHAQLEAAIRHDEWDEPRPYTLIAMVTRLRGFRP